MKRILSFSIAFVAIYVLISGAIVPSSLHAQSAAQGSWSAKAPLSIKLSEFAVTAANGKIYVIGGSTPDVVDLRLNQEYDPATDRWHERAPLPAGRHGFGAVAVARNLYFAAGALGCGGGERSDQLLVFSLP